MLSEKLFVCFECSRLMKRDLDKLRKEVKESPECKRAKRSKAVSTSTSGILQKI